MKDRIYLLPETGKFYKANLHSHTVLSDGALTAGEMKQLYKQKGYSVLAYTDHRTYQWHKELTDDGFVALAGYEVDLDQEFKKEDGYSRVKTYHMNFYDSNPEVFQEEKRQSRMPSCSYDDIDGINRFIGEMRELGFFVCYNHPYWSLQNYDDYKGVKGLWGMEIFNYGCEIDGLYGYNPQSYDEMLRQGHKIFCVSTDDNHNKYPVGDPLCDSFGGFTMIKAERLTYEGITEALLKGDFYCSMGPEIRELYMESGNLVVRTSPAEKIYVVTEGRNCHMKLAKPGETIDEAVFPLWGNEGYIRVDVRDGKGLHANSNAYWLK